MYVTRMLKRTRVQLSSSLEKKLSAYALAALGAVATTPAKAAVVYTSVMEKREAVKPYSSVSALIDLNHDGQTDFEIVGSFFASHATSIIATFNHADVFVQADGSNQIALATGEAEALNVHWQIGPHLDFAGNNNFNMANAFTAFSDYENSHGGQFFNQQNKFLGLKLVLQGKHYYGWARVSTQLVGNKLSFELVDYAYQTIPDIPMVAGEGIPNPDAALDARRFGNGASLGLLALGTDALPVWRNRANPRPPQ